MPKRPAALNFSSTSGLSLLEIMLAITIAVMAITALVVISNTAIGTANSSRNQATADQYVREGLEGLRTYRDNSGWNSLTSGLTPGSTKLYVLSGATLTGQADTPVTNPCTLATLSNYQIPSSQFYRVVAMKLDASATVDTITVTVCYKNRAVYFSDAAQTVLTNWR